MTGWWVKDTVSSARKRWLPTAVLLTKVFVSVPCVFWYSVVASEDMPEKRSGCISRQPTLAISSFHNLDYGDYSNFGQACISCVVCSDEVGRSANGAERPIQIHVERYQSFCCDLRFVVDHRLYFPVQLGEGCIHQRHFVQPVVIAVFHAPPWCRPSC